jgi:hypothetical protein
VTFKRWVLSAWSLDKWNDWDCTYAEDIAASDVAKTMDEQTKRFGPPATVFGYGGETVGFEWQAGPDSKVALKQKPCD